MHPPTRPSIHQCHAMHPPSTLKPVTQWVDGGMWNTHGTALTVKESSTTGGCWGGWWVEMVWGVDGCDGG
eukprot:5701727-Prorocentrum_lima.AAC.1